MKCSFARGLGLALGFAAAGCLSSSKPVRMPGGERALRIECHYDRSNCERRAAEECRGRYDVVTKGDTSCEDCGLQPSSPTGGLRKGSEVFTGVLYVRCRDARAASASRETLAR